MTRENTVISAGSACLIAQGPQRTCSPCSKHISGDWQMGWVMLDPDMGIALLEVALDALIFFDVAWHSA